MLLPTSLILAISAVAAKPGDKIWRSASASSTIRAVAADGNYVFTGTSNSNSQVWNITTGARLLNFDAHGGSVRTIGISGNYWFTGSADDSVKQWKLLPNHTAEYVCTYQHEVTAQTLYIRDDVMFTGSADNMARSWNITNCRATRNYTVQESDIYGVFPYGDYLYAGDRKGDIVKHHINNGSVMHTFKTNNTSPINAIFVTKTSLFAAADDKAIYKWNKHTGAVEHYYLGHTDKVRSIYVRGNVLYSGANDDDVYAWDVTTGAQLYNMTGTATKDIYNLNYYDGHIYAVDGNYITKYEASAFTCPSGLVEKYSSMCACPNLGYYENSSGVCTACPSGSASSAFGESSCESCAPNGYMTGTGKLTCTPCPMYATCTTGTSYTCTHGTVNGTCAAPSATPTPTNLNSTSGAETKFTSAVPVLAVIVVCLTFVF